jgi:predicted peroxiredoxin
MKIKIVSPVFILAVLIVGSVSFNYSNSNAQNSTTPLQLQNSTGNPDTEEKSYILIFGQRTIGNIDNSTKIVSSIVGHNLVKIAEEFVEEISLAPTPQLEEQVDKIIHDGLNGSSCGSSLTTQRGEIVSVDCISSGNIVIWFIHPELEQ